MHLAWNVASYQSRQDSASESPVNPMLLLKSLLGDSTLPTRVGILHEIGLSAAEQLSRPFEASNPAVSWECATDLYELLFQPVCLTIRQQQILDRFINGIACDVRASGLARWHHRPYRLETVTRRLLGISLGAILTRHQRRQPHCTRRSVQKEHKVTLSLITLRTPDGVVPAQLHVDGDGVTLGRGNENDWVMQDPERVLSKRHCAMTCRNNIWQVVDSSRIGTFLNGLCLDPGVPRPLRNGDRVAFGAYEIEVMIKDEPSSVMVHVDDANLLGDLDRLTNHPVPQAEPSCIGKIGFSIGFKPFDENVLFGNTALPNTSQAPANRSAFVPMHVELQLRPEDRDKEWYLTETSSPQPGSASNETGLGKSMTLVVQAGSFPKIPDRHTPAGAGVATSSDELTQSVALIATAAETEGNCRDTRPERLQVMRLALWTLAVVLCRKMTGRVAGKRGVGLEKSMIHPHEG